MTKPDTARSAYTLDLIYRHANGSGDICETTSLFGERSWRFQFPSRSFLHSVALNGVTACETQTATNKYNVQGQRGDGFGCRFACVISVSIGEKSATHHLAVLWLPSSVCSARSWTRNTERETVLVYACLRYGASWSDVFADVCSRDGIEDRKPLVHAVHWTHGVLVFTDH